jgi:hypothetical protein
MFPHRADRSVDLVAGEHKPAEHGHKRSGSVAMRRGCGCAATIRPAPSEQMRIEHARRARKTWHLVLPHAKLSPRIKSRTPAAPPAGPMRFMAGLSNRDCRKTARTDDLRLRFGDHIVVSLSIAL